MDVRADLEPSKIWNPWSRKYVWMSDSATHAPLFIGTICSTNLQILTAFTSYRVPPLAAKPRSRRTPHARTFGPSTECTRCICAARKPTAWLHDTARCPRSIRDSVEQCAAPCRCEHQRSIRTSRVCCHALSTRATAPLQTFGVVAVRQRSVHCS